MFIYIFLPIFVTLKHNLYGNIYTEDSDVNIQPSEFIDNCSKHQELLIEGRRNSKKWKDSVTSEEYRNLKRETSSRSKKLKVDGVLYNSIREASGKTDISYYSLRMILLLLPITKQQMVTSRWL